MGLIWLVAVVVFLANGSVDLFNRKLTARADFTPFVVALLLSMLAFAGMVFIWRQQMAAGKSLSELQALSPSDFEDWVAARFRRLGYSVKVAGASGDHGVGLVAEKPGELAVVQCKNYRAWSIGEPVVRDLFGAIHDFGAGRAYLVTTGRVTPAARQWAKGKPIEIWDEGHVVRLLKQEAPGNNRHESELLKSTPAPERGVAASYQSPGHEVASRTNRVRLTCPKCSSILVEKRDRATGEPFLACPRYPICRYTQPVPPTS